MHPGLGTITFDRQIIEISKFCFIKTKLFKPNLSFFAKSVTVTMCDISSPSFKILPRKYARNNAYLRVAFTLENLAI